MNALVPRRDYLAGQRRSIIARSLMGSLAGAVPLPFVDDWAINRIVGGGYKRIAASHQVDLTDEGAANLVHGTTAPPSVLEIATSGIALRNTSLVYRPLGASGRVSSHATSCASARRSSTSAPSGAVAATPMRMVTEGRRGAAASRAPLCGARRRCGR